MLNLAPPRLADVTSANKHPEPNYPDVPQSLNLKTADDARLELCVPRPTDVSRLGVRPRSNKRFVQLTRLQRHDSRTISEVKERKLTGPVRTFIDLHLRRSSDQLHHDVTHWFVSSCSEASSSATSCC